MKYIIAMLLRVPLIQLGRQLVRNRAIATLRRKDTTIVWHIGMPKSGSSWLSWVIRPGLVQRGWQSAKLAPAAGRREAEIDPKEMLRHGCFDSNLFATQLHAPYTEYAVQFIREFGVRVILQVRSIPDCLVSFLDHLNFESVVWPMCYLEPGQWARLTEEERVKFVIDFVAPWYVKFWVGWSAALAEADIPIHLVKYEDLRADPLGQFLATARFCDPAVSEREVEDWIAAAKLVPTRKNKAVVGRGQVLPAAAKDQLARLAGYYPDVDFSSVGLQLRNSEQVGINQAGSNVTGNHSGAKAAA
jgi:hypothetical protein